LLVACLSVAVGVNTLWNGFVYDDKNILLSPLLHDPWNLSAFFSNHFYPNIDQDVRLYRPLSNLFYVVNVRLVEWFTGTPASPAGMHAVTVLMHAGVACLFLAWLTRLDIRRSLALSAAALFAVLSIHSEVVASIYNRSEAQAALFGLLFLILHRRGWWLAAAPTFLLAMWSKESALAFLPVALFADVLFPREELSSAQAHGRVRFGAFAAYAGVAVLWMILRADVLQGTEESTLVIENPLRSASFAERVLTVCKTQLEYLRLQLLPVQLSSDYSFRQIPIVTRFTDPHVLGFVVILAVSATLAWRWRRRQPIVLFAVAGYAACFALTSNLLVPIGTLMGERLAYAPSLFFVLLSAHLAWSTERWVGRRAVVAGLILLTGAFAVKSAAQNRFWRDDLTLFAEQVRTAPNSAKSHLNYGAALDVDAIGMEQRALGMDAPQHAAEQTELQQAALARRREALAQYEASASLYAEYGHTYYMIGNSLHALKEPTDRIVAAYRTAVRLDPYHVDARVNLAATLIEARRFDEARAVVHEIAALDPGHRSLPALQRLLAAAPSAPGTPIPVR
jgi:hypothetical protein